MKLDCRDDYAADAREDAQRRSLAPAATALLQLSGVLAQRNEHARSDIARAALDRLDQRLYGCQMEGRDLTTDAIGAALVDLSGACGAVGVAEYLRACEERQPGPGQHYCQRPGQTCNAFVDCAKAAAHEFCDGPEPHLCAACHGDGK